jgi:hypothetical protein
MGLECITMVHGPPGSGKTQYLMTLAHSILTGGVFLESYPCVQGPVVMIELDMIPRLVQERLKHTERLFGRLPFYQVAGSEFMNVFDWYAAGDKHKIVRELRDLKPAAVMVDTYKRSFKVAARRDFSEAENEASLVYQAWRSVCPGAAIIFTHHDKKKPTGPFGGDPNERYSGHVTIVGSADTGLRIQRERKYAHRHVAKVSQTKARLSEEHPPMFVEMDPDTLLMKPTEPTARELAHGFAEQNPKCTATDIWRFLDAKGACGRSRAYQIAEDILARKGSGF